MDYHSEPTHVSDALPEVLAKYSIKAIQTRYDGILFRSRIEARWAVFFNSLGLAYEYEKEGYDLGDGKSYLPDFWLPTLEFFVEIKGADPDEDSCDLAERLAIGSGRHVYVFFGGIIMPTDPWTGTHAYCFFPDGGADYEYRWCECSSCGQLGIQFDGRSDRLPCKESYESAKSRRVIINQPGLHFPKDSKPENGCPRSGANFDKGYNTNSPRLMRAYAAARSERFGR